VVAASGSAVAMFAIGECSSRGRGISKCGRDVCNRVSLQCVVCSVQCLQSGKLAVSRTALRTGAAGYDSDRGNQRGNIARWLHKIGGETTREMEGHSTIR
jgi:hypothetical protein